jgi:hypothetical protein
MRTSFGERKGVEKNVLDSQSDYGVVELFLLK